MRFYLQKHIVCRCCQDHQDKIPGSSSGTACRSCIKCSNANSGSYTTGSVKTQRSYYNWDGTCHSIFFCRMLWGAINLWLHVEHLVMDSERQCELPFTARVLFQHSLSSRRQENWKPEWRKIILKFSEWRKVSSISWLGRTCTNWSIYCLFLSHFMSFILLFAEK